MERHTEEAASDTASYQPYLDGLRAVAVYLVVGFHAGINRLSGGFIGVDVFFVLSGFLVTRTLLRRRAGTGRIGFGWFYARRVRRLLPAAFINLLATAAIFSWMASPTEARTALGTIRWAALYSSNWWFIRENADYFGSAIEANPVLHYWSLSVEEQFYFVWPLLLSGLIWLGTRLGRRTGRFEVAIVAAAAAASLIGALVIERTNQALAYYGTHTRAYQLLAGSLLALVPGVLVRATRWKWSERIAPLVSATAFASLMVVGTSVISVTPVQRGAITTVLTLALLLSLQTGHRDWLRRLLSIEPMSYLGKISYGTYLWHWIIMLVLVRQLDLTSRQSAVIGAVAASAIAALSYEVVEKPIRERGWGRAANGPSIAVGLALSLIVATVAAPRILDRTLTVGVGRDQAVGGTPIPIDLDQALADNDPAFFDCPIDTAELCPLHDGSGPRVLLLGDSHALMMAPAFKQAAVDLDLDLSSSSMRFCPWLPGIAYFWPDAQRCYDLQRHALRVAVDQADPQLVILVHRAVDDPVNPMVLMTADAGRLEPGRDREALVAERLTAEVERLRRDGRRVLLIEPTPLATPLESSIDCLSGADFTEECRRIAAIGPTPEEAVMRGLADDHDDVWTMDLDGLVCPYLPICDPVVDGRVVTFDGTHLGYDFGLTMADDFANFLVDNEVLTGLDP